MVPQKGIAVAGNIILDYYKEIDTYPAHSTLTNIRRIKKVPGGALCNCSIDLARIDPKLDIKAIGIVGRDEAGQEILKQLANYANIDCSGIIREGETSFTDVLIDLGRHTRTFLQFRGANSKLDIDHFDIGRLDVSIFHIGYILLLDALDTPDTTYGTRMARLLHLLQQAGIKTSIDIVSEQSERFAKLVPPALKYTDYCIINEIEASRTTGMVIRDDHDVLLVDQVRLVCRALLDMGVGQWAIIHAREGAVGLSRSGEFVCLPALNVSNHQIMSTTGAGDAFLSGALYGAWQNYSLSGSIELGLAAAARSLICSNSTDGVIAEPGLRSFYQDTGKENWPGFGKE